MNKNTSVSLGEHFDKFIKNEISSGRYKSTSEVIREGLRMLEQKQLRESTIRKAIQEGIDSGTISNFSIDEFLKELEAKHT